MPLRVRPREKFVRRQAAVFMAVTNSESLLALNESIEAGKVTPLIDRRYSLGETAQAFTYLNEGHARSKVVIAI